MIDIINSTIQAMSKHNVINDVSLTVNDDGTTDMYVKWVAAPTTVKQGTPKPASSRARAVTSAPASKRAPRKGSKVKANLDELVEYMRKQPDMVVVGVDAQKALGWKYDRLRRVTEYGREHNILKLVDATTPMKYGLAGEWLPLP